MKQRCAATGVTTLSEYTIARAQFIKTKRTETRHRFSLMADAEIAENLPLWREEFDRRAREQAPQVLNLQSELRRLTDGGPK